MGTPARDSALTWQTTWEAQHRHSHDHQKTSTDEWSEPPRAHPRLAVLVNRQPEHAYNMQDVIQETYRTSFGTKIVIVILFSSIDVMQANKIRGMTAISKLVKVAFRLKRLNILTL